MRVLECTLYCTWLVEVGQYHRNLVELHQTGVIETDLVPTLKAFRNDAKYYHSNRIQFPSEGSCQAMRMRQSHVLFESHPKRMCAPLWSALTEIDSISSTTTQCW